MGTLEVGMGYGFGRTACSGRVEDMRDCIWFGGSE
jgi:hypothetical protein